MSHHGPIPPPSPFMEELLGATKKFPEGKLNDDDEGELRLAIAADPKGKKVIINFGKPVAWIGFNPSQAREIAALLLEKADEALAENGGGE